jgi:hypothetical protein
MKDVQKGRNICTRENTRNANKILVSKFEVRDLEMGWEDNMKLG